MALANYVDVQVRINQFWDDYPDGAIRTRLESDLHDFTVCRYRAEVYKQRDNPFPDAVGYAFEVRQDAGKGANVTSHEENCETSAIGRALANMGYAKDGKNRPSKQEMSKVERAQEANVSVQAPQRPPDAPKPANAGTDTPPVNLDREKVMKALHATGKDAGLEHIDLHNLIVAKGHESMTTAPVEALVDLGKALKADPGKLKAWLAKQAELMPTETDVPNPERFTS